MNRAVPVMEVGPPGSPSRRRFQTAAVSCRSRAGVGSDCGNGPLSAGQVGDEKTNVCEPLLTRRKAFDDIETGKPAYPGIKERSSGRSLGQGAACVWPWWCPAYRWREVVAGAGMEQENLSSRYRWPVDRAAVGPLAVDRENRERRQPRAAEYRCEAQGRADS